MEKSKKQKAKIKTPTVKINENVICLVFQGVVI